ncbi:hypothetical protein A8E86_08760 [Burkholderia cenocepacia]|jgi:hypothetical protein|uniref:hypothetical protein n=1 Tax=Burkholderia cenocepacia TaxID=95486 RepID=UPI000553A45C|nr:hypothetical protein [Burkholderia cenocepacia]ONQ66859.1 hypothetical protein A8E06_26805 [Burkholderia cenocepacia]ONS56433.1 hypothetical protein A8E32_23145 [Burkholderia cenocepacia]ONV50670.1 hypothetical protein A8E76_27895 [Burkholderia cenocepacia]ONW06068.1 hypothetical protein A8E86_08760 [Burkholderia cenocepacia]
MSLMSGSLSVTANSILVDGAGTQSVGNTARMIPRRPIHQTISTLADALVSSPIAGSIESPSFRIKDAN